MSKRILYLSVRLLPVLGVIWLLGACQYRPPLTPANGYTLKWVTQTQGIDAYTRSVKRFLELSELFCHYVLLGWADSTTLYYRQSCPSFGKDAQAKVFAYHLRTESISTETIAPFDKLYFKVNNLEVMNNVRLPNMRPAELEPITRRLFIKGDSLAAPDQKHTAIVTKWLYGPEDVMILSRD